MNFPSNPSVNQTYTYGNRTWKYNGVAWELQPAALLPAVIPNLDASKITSGTLAAARLPTHAHAISDVTGLQAALDGKQEAGSYAPASHTHTLASVTDVAVTSPTNGQVLKYNSATGKWTNQADTNTTYSVPTLAELQTGTAATSRVLSAARLKEWADWRLAGFSTVGHTHAIADVEGLQAALDGKLGLGGGALTGQLDMLDNSVAFNNTLLFSPLTETDVLNVRRYSGEYTLLNVMAPPQRSWGGAQEATLALVRGDGNEYFLDLYNMDYGSNDAGNHMDYGEPQMGIRMQKRGTGTYTPFYIEYGDGTDEVRAIEVFPRSSAGLTNDTQVNIPNLLTVQGQEVWHAGNFVPSSKLDASAFTWANLAGKPTTFTPSAHTHTIAQVTGLQSALDGKAPTSNPSFTGAATFTGNVTASSFTMATAYLYQDNTSFAVRAGTSASGYAYYVFGSNGTLRALNGGVDAAGTVGGSFVSVNGSAPGTQQAHLAFRRGGVVHWQMGTEAGREFSVWAYDDSGGYIRRALGIDRDGYISGRAFIPEGSNGSVLFGNTGGIEVSSQFYVGGTSYLMNASRNAWVRQPRIFVQSGDPGAAASDGDLWIW